MIVGSTSKRKKTGSSSSSSSCLSVVSLSVLVLIIFIFVIVRSHYQLFRTDLPSRFFVDSRLRPFSTLKTELEVLSAQTEAPPAVVPPARTPSPTSSPVREHPPPLTSSAPSRADAFDPRSVSSDSYYRLLCPHGHLLSYWRPAKESDLTHQNPFVSHGPQPKYVTFEPDVGGWNNIRMQMELVLVFAYATGRTLVLPPDQPMYLLNAGKGHQKAHSFTDFFPFEKIRERMNVISMEEFMEREAITGHLKVNNSTPLYPPGNKTVFIGTERDDRLAMWAYLRQTAACPAWKSMEEFLVIPASPGSSRSEKTLNLTRLTTFAANRTAQFYDSFWQNQKVIHFISKPELGYRLLEHFYTFLYFEDLAIDHFFKRFVRDYVHYQRDMMCKAALIIHQLMVEGNGSFIAFHIRRGEFQYKVVKISAERMINNLRSSIPKDRLVFVATDERNKSFFDPFRKHFKTVRFLDDFTNYADLHEVNPNYLGMIDQIICTKGEYFVGTWFSTFSGYITRVRGYLGYADATTFYGDKAHRDRFQRWEDPKFPFYMREFPTAWTDIDS